MRPRPLRRVPEVEECGASQAPDVGVAAAPVVVVGGVAGLPLGAVWEMVAVVLVVASVVGRGWAMQVGPLLLAVGEVHRWRSPQAAQMPR